jgi:hypothetical protein
MGPGSLAQDKGTRMSINTAIDLPVRLNMFSPGFGRENATAT